MTKILLIALGGGVGSVLRYVVSGWGRVVGESFPWGTLLVNVIGCLAFGFLVVALGDPERIRPEFRVALLVGLLGGFTTFSTFGYETFALGNDRQFAFALANVLLSVCTGLVAMWIGHRLAEKLFGV